MLRTVVGFLFLLLMAQAVEARPLSQSFAQGIQKRGLKTKWIRRVRIGSSKQLYNVRFRWRDENTHTTEYKKTNEAMATVSLFQITKRGTRLRKTQVLSVFGYLAAFEVIRHRRSQTTFLACSCASQFPHEYLWRLNPRTLEAKKTLDVLMGDTRELADRGQIVENTPAHYVYINLPHRTIDGRYAVRVWRYDSRRRCFVHGNWHRDGNWKGGQLAPGWTSGTSHHY